MNSSTKLPLGNSHKFQFDVDFELEAERLRLEVLRQEELARKAHDEQYTVPHYTEDDLVRTRQEGFQSGYDQGMADARKTIEQTLSELTDRMIGKLQFLMTEEETRWETAQRLAITTTMATMKKFWPHLVQNLGAQMVEETIRQSLDINNSEARIVVRVHDSLLDDVVARLPQLKEQQAFSGKVIVLSDDSVAKGDCKVEWADGGLERLGRTLSGQLDEALNRILAGVTKESPANPHNKETERMSS